MTRGASTALLLKSIANAEPGIVPGKVTFVGAIMWDPTRPRAKATLSFLLLQSGDPIKLEYASPMTRQAPPVGN
jgi:hypothetical protein